MLEEQNVLITGLFLMTASIVAMAARRAHIPYSVALVAAGALLAISPVSVPFSLSRDLIFLLLLPPLLFEAALHLPWREFRRNLGLSLTLAGPGVGLAALVAAAGLHFLLDWTWIGAGLFGALIAATDPVAVIAVMRDAEVDTRLRTVMESESLLNDGLAASLFSLILLLSGDPPAPLLTVSETFLWEAGGGLLIGGTIGGLLLLVAGRTDDHLVEISLSSVAAFGSFLIADRAHMSGVLAVVAAGLVTANVAWMRAISAHGRDAVSGFWEYAAFLSNSVIFIMVGIQEAREPLLDYWLPILVAYGLTLAARLVSAYPIVRYIRWHDDPFGPRSRAMLLWSGLRGAVALALALAVPASVEEKDMIVVTAFGVVALSMFVQGMTIPALVRKLGLAR